MSARRGVTVAGGTRLVGAGVALVVAWALSGGQARVCAWGAQGHHVISRIAWALMAPAAQDRAAALLDGRQEAFVASSTWADEVRSARPETYNWHFVDIPVGQAHYDAARDCAPTDKGDCVVAALTRARAELEDPARPRELKAESLKFLIHFVGDVHQPLHAIDNHDRGGNDVRVAALRGEDGRATNLHSAWDTGLLNLSTETEAARAERLLEDLRAHPPAASRNAVTWAEDSHDLAERVAYSYPGFSPGAPPADAVTLDEAYRARALAVIDRQLELAGARLGELLNAVLGGQVPASAPDAKLIRIYVQPITNREAGETVDPAGLRQSTRDILAALANKKKTLVVVDSEPEADVVVKVIERTVTTPKVVMGLGPRPGELLPMTGPSRLVTLKVTLTSGRDILEFANKNKPVEAQEGWKVAASEVAGQIDKWVAAHREEILKRRAP